MVMEARRLDHGRGDPAPTGPHAVDADYGARLLEALERFDAHLETLRWSAREEIRLADRASLVDLFKRRHEILPSDLESAIRTQLPEALAYRLAGDPRLLRVVELLSLRG